MYTDACLSHIHRYADVEYIVFYLSCIHKLESCCMHRSMSLTRPSNIFLKKITHIVHVGSCVNTRSNSTATWATTFFLHIDLHMCIHATANLHRYMQISIYMCRNFMSEILLLPWAHNWNTVTVAGVSLFAFASVLQIWKWWIRNRILWCNTLVVKRWSNQMINTTIKEGE
jgi:hypothetical protein